MELNEYQERAMQTCTKSSNNVAYMLYNLLGEVGELAGKINDQVKDPYLTDIEHDLSAYGALGKAIRKLPESWASKCIVLDFDKHLEAFKRDTLLHKELGDILWQLSGLCKVLGLTLEEVAEQNLDKLAKRQAQGTIVGDGDER